MTKNENTFLTLRDGIRLYYEKVGSGAPVLLLHGLFGKAEDYKDVVAQLSTSFCCVSFDLRGHGKSKATSGFDLATLAEDLRELITTLQLKGCAAVGYSTGALVLLAYVERYGSEGFSRVALLDIAPKLLNDDEWSLGMYRGNYAQENLDADLALIEKNYYQFASYFTYRNMTKFDPAKPLRTKPPLLAKVIARLVIGGDAAQRQMTRDLWANLFRCDFRATLAKITCPIEFIHADPGSLFAPEVASYMQNQIVGASSYAVKNASHAMLFSHGKEIASELARFLEE